jgi:hypothetical protein
MCHCVLLAARSFRMILGAVVLIAIIGLSAAGVVPLLEAACVGCLILLGVKSITIHEAFYCIKPRVLLTIIASFGIGKSLAYSGLASWIAQGLVGFTAPMGASLSPCRRCCVASAVAVALCLSSCVSVAVAAAALSSRLLLAAVWCLARHLVTRLPHRLLRRRCAHVPHLY